MIPTREQLEACLCYALEHGVRGQLVVQHDELERVADECRLVFSEVGEGEAGGLLVDVEDREGPDTENTDLAPGDDFPVVPGVGPDRSDE